MKHICLFAALLFSTISGFTNDGGKTLANASVGRESINEVRFISFVVKKTPVGAVLLNWTTAKEANSSHFNIESSADGLSWKTIALVFTPENPAKINKYNYTHKARTKEEVYFRIRMMDKLGKSLYSSVKIISANNKAAETPIYTEQKNSTLEISQSTESVMMRLINTNVL